MKNIDSICSSFVQVLADQQQTILRQLLEEPPNHEDNNATIKAKYFYKSCMNTSKHPLLIFEFPCTCSPDERFKTSFCSPEKAQIRKTGVEPMIELLNYYGGWPILNPDWTKPNQTIEELMGRMRSELNEHFLISILVGPDDKNSSVNVLLVK